MSAFQKVVNIFNAAGLPGSIAFSGPQRSQAYNLNSSGTPQVCGYAFTISSAADADPAAGSPNGATARVGGTGVFAGILIAPKEQVLTGAGGDPLAASITLPDNTVGELMDMGYVWANLPGPANPGDLVTYDPATGALNSIPPGTAFTAAIAPGGSAGVADVMTVSAITKGQIYVGMPVSGAGVAGGTVVASFGTGKGATGTYNLSTINSQTVGSEAMTGGDVPAPAFAASAAYITTAGGVDTLHITTLTSGELTIGQQVFGAGVAPNTVITDYGSGVGGTGTYILNTSGQVVASSGSPEAMTGPSNLLVPNAKVYRYGANSAGGNAVIQLTN